MYKKLFFTALFVVTAASQAASDTAKLQNPTPIATAPKPAEQTLSWREQAKVTWKTLQFAPMALSESLRVTEAITNPNERAAVVAVLVPLVCSLKNGQLTAEVIQARPTPEAKLATPAVPPYTPSPLSDFAS